MNFFKKITKGFINTVLENELVDSSRFGDPIANLTSWNSINEGSANFKTYRLVEIGGNRMEFKPTPLFTFLLCLIIFFLGWAIAHILIGEGYGFSSQDEIIRTLGYFVMVCFLIWTINFFFWYRRRSIVFDKKVGHFWIGESDINTKDSNDENHSILLSQIHALQLLSDYISKVDDSGYYNYELNLVLKDGSRKNVIYSGNKKAIIKDSQSLAAFLNISLWNAIR